jgi:hypothetical protein
MAPKSREWLKPFLSRYSPKALSAGITTQKIVKDWKRPEDKNQKVMVKMQFVKGSGISAKTLASYRTKSDLSKISSKNIAKLSSLYKRINYAHLKANGANTVQATKYRNLSLDKVDSLISQYKRCTALVARQRGLDPLAAIYGFNKSKRASIEDWGLWEKQGGSPTVKGKGAIKHTRKRRSKGKSRITRGKK